MGRNVVEVIINAKDKASGKLKGVGQSAGGMGKAFAVAGAAIVAAAAVAGAAMMKLVNSTVKWGDEMAKNSKRLGVTTEFLSEMEHAAKIAGASSGELYSSLKRMARSASDAANGLMTQKRAFDYLNISVADNYGQLKNSEVLFLEVADALSKMDNATKKAALSQELFGRGGDRLLVLLNGGAAGMKKLREEARALGGTLSGEAAESMEEYADSIVRMQTAFKGLKIEATGFLDGPGQGVIDWATRQISYVSLLIKLVTDLNNAYGDWKGFVPKQGGGGGGGGGSGAGAGGEGSDEDIPATVPSGGFDIPQPSLPAAGSGTDLEAFYANPLPAPDYADTTAQFSSALGEMEQGAASFAGSVSGMFGSMFGSLMNGADNMGEMMKGIFSSIMSMLVSMALKMAFLNIFKIGAGAATGGAAGVAVMAMNRGGEWIPHARSGLEVIGGQLYKDTVPAVVSRGEVVMPSPTVERLNRFMEHGGAGGNTIYYSPFMSTGSRHAELAAGHRINELIGTGTGYVIEGVI